jgi:hypothetical protein
MGLPIPSSCPVRCHLGPVSWRGLPSIPHQVNDRYNGADCHGHHGQVDGYYLGVADVDLLLAINPSVVEKYDGYTYHAHHGQDGEGHPNEGKGLAAGRIWFIGDCLLLCRGRGILLVGDLLGSDLRCFLLLVLEFLIALLARLGILTD